MLELIKNILKILQILFLFIIPFIIVYWVIVQANLPSFIGIQAILSLVLDPIILPLGSLYNYSILFKGQSVDMTAFVAIGVLLGFLLVAHILIIIIEFLQQKIVKMEEYNRIKDEEQIQKEVVNKYINNLKNHKIFYLMVGICKSKSNISYLLDDTEKDESNLHVQEFIEHSGHYNGNLISKNEEADIQNYFFVFYSQEEILNYAFYMKRNIKNLKSKLIQSGIDVNCRIVIDCALNESKNESIAKVLEKMINVAGANHIICTSIFAEKYKNTGENTKIKFNSNGMYSILNQKYELFNVEKEL